MIALGIDLGTTYSAVAYVNSLGQPEIVSNREGERITPSVVLFDGSVPLVGMLAKQMSNGNSLNLAQFVKRQMGEPAWRFTTEFGQEYRAEEISALILKRMAEDARTLLNCEIRDAVITVPAYFNDAQRKATQDAGRIAGLNVLRIINEPTAAALAYGAIGKACAGQTVMVYDLGGGTFDVTILRIADRDVRVLATGGDKNLGGFDWDNALMVHLNDAFVSRGGPSLLDDPEREQKLRSTAELAKRTLSVRHDTRVLLAAGNTSVTIDLSRATFESLTMPHLQRTKVITDLALSDAGLTWNDLDKVLLVGGSTRMPAVHALLERLSGKKPSQELHPDEVVALGAAVLAQHLHQARHARQLNAPASLPAVRIVDVNSHSLGVIALDGATGRDVNSIILPRNSAIPTKASKRYGTVADHQTCLAIRVTEGEDEDVDYVRVVGTADISIPPYPRGAPVDVSFSYDFDGLIRVEVFDVTANRLLGEMHIHRESNLGNAEVQAAERRIAAMQVG